MATVVAAGVAGLALPLGSRKHALWAPFDTLATRQPVILAGTIIASCRARAGAAGTALLVAGSTCCNGEWTQRGWVEG